MGLSNWPLRLGSKLPSNSISVEGWPESMLRGHFETLEPRTARHLTEPIRLASANDPNGALLTLDVRPIERPL